jgi:hypothetical protein
MTDLESKIAFDPRAPEKAKSKLHQKTMATKDKRRVSGFRGTSFDR